MTQAAPNINRGIPMIVPARQVLPSPGDLLLQCEKCGGQKFAVFVKPNPALPTEMPKVANLVCRRCATSFKVTPAGMIYGSGKREANPKNHRGIIGGD